MKGYKIPFLSSPFQSRLPTEKNFSVEEFQSIKIEIDKLIKKGAIEECKREENGYISSYFLVPKPDGSNRFIFNSKNLNKYVESIHFKMEDIRSAKNLITNNTYMSTIDLKDAYYLVPVDKSHGKYLKLKFENKLYRFTCLPFGLSSSPYIFTKIMKPVVSRLRALGILSVIYLDDLLILGNSLKNCGHNVNQAKELLEHLGLVINYKKSNLTPSQSCKYLGFILNSKNLSLELTQKKKDYIKNLLGKFKEGNWYKILDIAQLLEVLTSYSPAVAYSSVYCKRLEREKFLALIFNDNNYEGKMIIKKYISEDLIWWKDNASIGKNPFKTQRYILEIFSDASLSGWGAYSRGHSSHGFWDEQEKKHHINYLELLAANFALKCYAGKFYNCEILLRLDKTTAIAYINKTGGVKYPYLSELARKIWQWCIERKLWIVASYIPSKENIEADAASRNKNIDTEWELSPKIFKTILKKFGPFSIDLFATRLNRKCKKFCSRFPDPDATTIDAFTIAWEKEKFYAFPPFALVLRCLRKIILDKAESIMVVPLWTTQPWYPLFTSLLQDRPVILTPNKNMLISPCRKIIHPLSSSLSLVVSRLSSQPLKTKA